MRAPLPVTVITGFLGAGKTTLIRRLLKAPHGLRIGLVLNEFGQAGIDAVETVDRAFVELTEGCACCLRNPDLVEAMHELSARGDLDRVILEPSGLADPLPLAWTLEKPELAGLVRLDAVVVVVDPLHLELAGREEWDAQVRAADVVVLSKRDVASAAAIENAEARVLATNPNARILTPDDAYVAELLLDVDLPQGPRASSLERTHTKHSDFRAITITSKATYDLDALEDLLEGMPDDVFRAKGIVKTREGWASFHVVGGRAQVEPDVAAPVHEESRLAFFGRGLAEDRVRALLDPCVVGEAR